MAKIIKENIDGSKTEVDDEMTSDTKSDKEIKADIKADAKAEKAADAKADEAAAKVDESIEPTEPIKIVTIPEDALAAARELIAAHEASILPTVITGPSLSGKVLIANHHTGAIVFPRKSQSQYSVSLTPIILGAGSITPIDAEEWAIRKAGDTVKHYLDRGILREVKQTGGDVSMISLTSEPPIPKNLQTETHQGDSASAKLTKSVNGEITI
jgi:vacuolar-type H+-ATPase subunit F/Vma7